MSHPRNLPDPGPAFECVVANRVGGPLHGPNRIILVQHRQVMMRMIPGLDHATMFALLSGELEWPTTMPANDLAPGNSGPGAPPSTPSVPSTCLPPQPPKRGS